MTTVLIIFLGGGFGALSRFGLTKAIGALLPAELPLGTLFVNVLGSFLIGLVVNLVNAALLHPNWRTMGAVGFIGAFTTFSTYALESITLMEKRAYGAAFWNFFLNNLLAFAAVTAGMLLANFLIAAHRSGSM
jgi:CrcB protein